MPILIDTSTLPSRIGVPSVPSWAVPRTRLAKRLNDAGLLTVISAPAGAGKTVGVASWARDLHPSVGVIWVQLRKGPDDLPLDQISADLAEQGRVVLVCDDFPVDPPAPLIQDLEMLLARPDRRLSIVLLCSTSSIVPIQLTDIPDLTTIDFDDLVMVEDEVGLILDQHGVEASEATIRVVMEHTEGWAKGVDLVAATLAQLSRSIPSEVQRAWAARAVERSLTVPRSLAGAGSEVVQQVNESKDLGESEPILLAAAAEAWIAAGEPQQAIASFTPEPDLAMAEAKLLKARARRLAGDPVARDSGPSRLHSPFLTSLPEPATAAVDHWRSDDHAYDGMIVVPLTTRETDVLRLLAQHCSNEEIAADLVLSLNTVKTHMRSLFQKLSVSRRADAVRRGRALGLC